MSETGDVRPRRFDDGDAGTTLIEALTVVGITALVALIGFPRLQQGLALMGQHQTISLVAARLREARARAILSDAPVVFTIARGGVAFGDPRRPDVASPGVTVAQSDAAGRPIVFYGDGSSTGGVIVVRGAHRANSVSVQPSGGAVAVTS